MPIINQKIFLHCSQIASFVNQNGYDYTTPFETIWKKVDSIEYNKALSELNDNLISKTIETEKLQIEKIVLQEQLDTKKITKTQFKVGITEINKKEQVLTKVVEVLTDKIETVKLNESQQISKVLGDNVVQIVKSITTETADKRIIVNKAIEDSSVSESVKVKLRKQTESFINKSHGTIDENSAIAIFEKKYKVKLNTDQEYHSIKFKETFPTTVGDVRGNYIYYIGGKVDGLFIDGENSYVVEVKNRVKGLFNSLRDYEKTQIQLYMYILNLQQAKLVEKYQSKIRVTQIQRDDDYIGEIMEYLLIFIKNFEKFLIDYPSKVEYLNCSPEGKKLFIKKLYLTEIDRKSKQIYEEKLIEKESAELDSDLDDF